MKQLEDQVLEIVRKFCSEQIKEKITLETPLDETGIDSLTMSEIIFEIEDVLGVPFPERDGPMFQTLREICAVLAENSSPAKAVNA